MPNDIKRPDIRCRSWSLTELRAFTAASKLASVSAWANDHYAGTASDSSSTKNTILEISQRMARPSDGDTSFSGCGLTPASIPSTFHGSGISPCWGRFTGREPT